jgi:hypothetical protein
VNPRDAVLARLADALVPGGSGLPPATAAGVPGHGVDAVLAARPELRAPFEQLLERLARSGPPVPIEQLRRDAPEDFALLTFVVAGGYLQDPQVQSALGYAGRVPAPLDEPDADTTFEAALLAPVRARGPIYRRVDETPHPP